jgi:RNA polymerase sigma factor (sigma-70 family)
VSGFQPGRRFARAAGEGWLAREQDFVTLYRAHAGGLLEFFARRTADAQASLDLTAETFAQAFAARGRFRGQSDEAARAWLFAIGGHLLAGYLRRGYAERRMVRRLRIEVPSIGEEAERIIELDAARRLRPLIERELDQLSADQRAAVRLRVVDELTFSAVAARLGISEPAARMRVSRGLSALTAAFERTAVTAEEV